MIQCNECGSTSLRKKGIRNGLQRYRCNTCGSWTYDTIEGRPAFEGPKEGFGKPISLLEKISSRYSIEELRALANGKGVNPNTLERPAISFSGDKVTIGFITDTHIGEESFADYLFCAFIEECRARGVQRILHAGDVMEGMSNRPDQVYHLTDVGISAQLDHAERLFKSTDIPITCIDGNHDRWAIKSSGMFAVRELARRCSNVTFAGSDCADVTINGTLWRLHHGEDGAAYALSYRAQKLVESFTGGDKPNILLTGHDHKAGYFFERNVHCVLGGALSYQSA